MAKARTTKNAVSKKTEKTDSLDILSALSKSQAMIEFEMDGTIITANENFLKAMGYRLEEIQGRHHSAGCARNRIYKMKNVARVIKVKVLPQIFPLPERRHVPVYSTLRQKYTRHS